MRCLASSIAIASLFGAALGCDHRSAEAPLDAQPPRNAARPARRPTITENATAAASVTSATTSADRAGAPKAPAFRVVNDTRRPLYVDANRLFECRAPDGSPCSFYPDSCRRACVAENRGGDCCVMCERDLPATIELAPGQSYVKSWDGNIVRIDTRHCAKCDCQRQLPITPGNYQVVVKAFASFRCETATCPKQPDGTLPSASPSGAVREHSLEFTVPSQTADVQIRIDE